MEERVKPVMTATSFRSGATAVEEIIAISTIATVGSASPVLRRTGSARPTSWLLLLGCLCAVGLGTAALSASGQAGPVAWVNHLGPASPLGTYRFALCPDDSSLAYASPGTLYRVDSTGSVIATASNELLNGTRSVDCAEVVRLLRVTAERAMQLVELDLRSLEEIRRVTIETPDGAIADGVRTLAGSPYVLLAGPTGPAIAPLDGASLGAGFGMRLTRPGRRVGNASMIVPMFYRYEASRFVVLQTTDYSIVEFDGAGHLHQIWRRDDADFARAELELVPSGFIRDERVLGAAMAPDGRLAVQVLKRSRDAGANYVEVLSPTYEVVDVWALPRKGTLFGWGTDGALHFGYAGASGVSIWKTFAPAA